MIRESNKRVQNYVKYLKGVMKDEGFPAEQIRSMSEREILDTFRHCLDCGTELITPEQQMHAILEFDTPEEAFLAIYEDLDMENCDEEVDYEGASGPSYRQVTPSELLAWKEEFTCTCSNSESEDSEPIDLRSVADGCQSIQSIIDKLDDYLGFLYFLQNEGFELKGPITDGEGLAIRDDEH